MILIIHERSDDEALADLCKGRVVTLNGDVVQVVDVECEQFVTLVVRTFDEALGRATGPARNVTMLDIEALELW